MGVDNVCSSRCFQMFYMVDVLDGMDNVKLAAVDVFRCFTQ